MVSKETFSAAMASRSLRTLRTELEFLSDLSVLSPQQVSSILAQLPAENEAVSSRQVQQQQPPPPVPAEPVPPAPIQNVIPPPVVPVQQPVPAPAPVAAPAPAPYLPPTNQFADTTLNEKTPVPAPQHYTPPPVPPPAYQAPPSLGIASAVYEYKASESGDLSFLPHDRIQILEHMNNDWWRGRNERTGQEGIFPSSYVDVMTGKGAPPPPPSGYGNMPLEVSQSGSGPADQAEDGKGNKFEQHGKKFGKKMGNAAIFGAGATMGSNIVNSIF